MKLRKMVSKLMSFGVLKGDSYVVSYNGAATVFSSSAASTVYTWNGTLLNYK